MVKYPIQISEESHIRFELISNIIKLLVNLICNITPQWKNDLIENG